LTGGHMSVKNKQTLSWMKNKQTLSWINKHVLMNVRTGTRGCLKYVSAKARKRMRMSSHGIFGSAKGSTLLGIIS
jgi:protein tyrosine phosphatase (PTP) superfamily phosphohydrolase (DUF442 family)